MKKYYLIETTSYKFQDFIVLCFFKTSSCLWVNTPWKSFSLQGIEIESEYGKIFTGKKSFLLFFHIFWNIKKITIRLHWTWCKAAFRINEAKCAILFFPRGFAAVSKEHDKDFLWLAKSVLVNYYSEDQLESLFTFVQG